MSSVVTTKDASLSSFSSTSNRKKKQNSFISRLLSRIVLPLILVLFVSDVLFYETEETKLRSVAKREETRVGSHKIDNHRQHSYRHQNEYNNEVLVRDGKPEEIAEIHDATKTSDDDAGDEGGGGAEKRSSGSRSSSSSSGTSTSGGGSSFDGVNNNNEDNSMGGSISGKAMMDGERCVASIRDGYSCEKFSLTSAEIVDVFHHATRASRRGGINKCTKAQSEEDGYLDDGGNGQKMVTDGMKIETVAGEKNSPSSSDALREALKKMFDERDTSHHGESIKYQKAVVVIDGTHMSADEASRLADATQTSVVFVAYGNREKFKEQQHVSAVLVKGESETGSPAHRLASVLLTRGYAVLVLSDKSAEFTANPLESEAFSFTTIGADVNALDDMMPAHVGFDIELATDITCRSNGQVIGIGDKSMGWSQYAQSVCLPMARSSFMRFNPTLAAIELCRYFGEHLDIERIGVDDRVTEQVIVPAYDNAFKAGARLKPFRHACRYNLKNSPSRGSRYAPSEDVSRGDELSGDPNAIIPSQSFDKGRSFALGDESSDDIVNKHKQCERSAWSEGSGPHPRKLRYVVPWPKNDDDMTSWPANCEGGSENLCEVVKKVAINREVLVGVSNKNIFHMLQLWIDGLQKTEITNYMIVALDEQTARWCEQHDAPYYLRSLTSITGSTDNHATSGLKFEILKEFIKIGVNVLLSDVDIVWMRDPFKNDLLYRDVDVEGMSDGWDDRTTYGFRWNPSRGRGNKLSSADELTYRMFVKNSGLFFTQATHESLQMMTVLANRMNTERSTWDQTAYNEEHTFLSDKKTPSRNSASSRIMNFACFCNSKYVFKYMRHDEKLYPEEKFHPASIHVNYHPEKPQRMLDIIKQYWKGEKGAIERWNGGEGLSSSVQCKPRPVGEIERTQGIQSSELAKHVADAHTGKWGGVAGIEWKDNGDLVTPWGKGTWGVIPDSDGKQLFMDWGPTHELTGRIEGGSAIMQSKRCPDGDLVPNVVADGL